MRVVQHVRSDHAGVVLAHLCDVGPGIAEHLRRLPRHRQEDVDGRIGRGVPGADQALVRGGVKAPAQPVGEQRQGEKQRPEQHERADEEEPVVLQHQPGLAEQQQRETGDREQGEDPGIAPHVLVFLVVARRHRQDVAGARGGRRGWRAHPFGSTGDGHRCGAAREGDRLGVGGGEVGYGRGRLRDVGHYSPRLVAYTDRVSPAPLHGCPFCPGQIDCRAILPDRTPFIPQAHGEKEGAQ